MVILQAIFPALGELTGRYNRSGDQQKVDTENKENIIKLRYLFCLKWTDENIRKVEIKRKVKSGKNADNFKLTIN